jgi:hypothetical protein
MDMIPLKPARKAQLEAYAQRHGQDAATALDDILVGVFDSEERQSGEAVEWIREGYADFKPDVPGPSRTCLRNCA